MRFTGLKYFRLTFLFLLLFGFTTTKLLKHGKKESPFQFEHDIDQHYSYLVGGIIKKDLGLNFPHGYWLYPAPNGKPIQRVTMGMAYLYSPFFLIGHAIAQNTDKYEANGYTKPYSVAMHLGSLLVVLLGVYFLMLCLNQFFNARLSVFLALLTLFGTNLFYYSFGLGEFSHSYLFALNVLFIYLTMLWHNDKNKKTLFLLGLLFGLMVLIRPTEILLIVFPLLYRVYDKVSLNWKLDLLKSNWKWILIAALLFFVPIIPQMLYWKTFGGSWVIYSYGKEGFFFDNPQIFNYLFSYRKGWFVYTPLMFLAIIGLALSFKKSRYYFWAILVPLIPTVYVFSSWWCWWYGGSFGMRSMIEFYGFLAFPLGTLFVYSKNWLKPIFIALALLFTAYNIRLTKQYRSSFLHWDSSSKATYWMDFLKVQRSDQELYEKSLIHPDYDNAMKGEPERKREEQN